MCIVLVCVYVVMMVQPYLPYARIALERRVMVFIHMYTHSLTPKNIYIYNIIYRHKHSHRHIYIHTTRAYVHACIHTHTREYVAY